MFTTVSRVTRPPTRYSFGQKWHRQVRSGFIKDHEKLIAHAVKVKILDPVEAEELTLRLHDLLGKMMDYLDQVPQIQDQTGTVVEGARATTVEDSTVVPETRSAFELLADTVFAPFHAPSQGASA